MKPTEGRQRVMIEDVRPQIDCGRFPVKRVVGDNFVVTAAVFGDGHDVVTARLLFKRGRDRAWRSVPMAHAGNDVWEGSFAVEETGRYSYCVEAWVDDFATWHRDFKKRAEAVQDLTLALQSGALLLDQAALRAKKPDAARLRTAAAEMRERAAMDQTSAEAKATGAAAWKNILSQERLALIDRSPDLRFATRHSTELELWVDRERAAFSAWYELFPRSTSPVEGRHGTFKDCELLLPSIAAMGFDVLYFPPIHPIGEAFRKGRNNAVDALPKDAGSPWAIGSSLGGHKSIHPELGTLEDFQHLLEQAKAVGLEIALDIAFQCSPDHPYVTEHPDWFRHRPDGSIQYAENPPKKYQDIYPLDFESPDWRALWDELKSVFVYWAEHGVRIYRVDNPHTKAFPFWEWVIAEVKKTYPDAIFLAEAFTRPHVMYGLAKRGFSQSYTYFTWRTTKRDLTEYFTELSQTEVREYFRPNIWPNTPDILHESLQKGGRPEFILRVILAATLGASYGIYGPAYELCENVPAKPGSEEYLNSEKYQIRHWARESSNSIAAIITRLNQIRSTEPALRNLSSLRFHPVDNDLMICYSKISDDRRNVVLAVVNLDPERTQWGWVRLDLGILGLAEDIPFIVQDMLGGAEYVWQGERNYVELTPETRAAHVFRVIHPQRAMDDKPAK